MWRCIDPGRPILGTRSLDAHHVQCLQRTGENRLATCAVLERKSRSVNFQCNIPRPVTRSHSRGRRPLRTKFELPGSIFGLFPLPGLGSVSVRPECEQPPWVAVGRFTAGAQGRRTLIHPRLPLFPHRLPRPSSPPPWQRIARCRRSTQSMPHPLLPCWPSTLRLSTLPGRPSSARVPLLAKPPPATRVRRAQLVQRSTRKIPPPPTLPLYFQQ
jgi:hypothetical protein